MTAPVDVLAVMKQAADFCQPTDPAEAPTLANAMDEARAAVAELIKAADTAAYRLEALARTFNSPSFTDRYGDGEACTERANRLRAALARVQP